MAEMTPDQYEVIVQDIASKLHEYAGVPADSIRVGKKNKWPGISGYSHQIDVSIEDKKNIILIECKKLGDKVDVPTFLSFLARVVDIYLQESRRGNLREIHSIVVTTVGFDPGVETLAAYYGIRLQLVQSVAEFALQYKNYWSIGVRDEAKFTQSMLVEKYDKDGNLNLTQRVTGDS